MSSEYFENREKSRRLNELERQVWYLMRQAQVANDIDAVQITITADEQIEDTITLDDISDLDALQYLDLLGVNSMKGDMNLGDYDITNINTLKLAIAPTNDTPSEGDVWWNSDVKTMNIKTDTDTVLQVNQEQVIRIYNDTGVTLNNGEVVYISGADVTSGRPTVSLGNATTVLTSEHIIGIVTSDILDTEQGFVTVFGEVRELNTAGMTAGDILYLGETDGEFTNIRPTFPAWVVEVGHVEIVDAAEGIILFHPTVSDNDHFFNGTIIENFDAIVTAAAGVITMSLERSGTGDLTMRFSSGYSILDCTPADTIILTAGTDTVPQENFVYIPESTGVLTLSTTAWPTSEHIKIAYFFVPSATKVETDGAYINQNWNNFTADVTTQRGRLELLSEKVRRLGSTYFSGIDPNGATDSYFTIGASTVDWLSTSGVIYQMNAQSVDAYDMSTGDDAHVYNDSVAPYKAVADLFEITAMADGTSLSNNKYFNLVFWMVANKGGEHSPLMVNLPTDQYTLEDSATRDDDKTAVYTIPREFNKESSTGFYVCRVTFKFGSTWTVVNVEDLRGRDPLVSGGSSAGTSQVEFSDSVHRIFNNADNTKEIAHDASSITAGTTRTMTVQDADGIIAYLADITSNIATHAAITNAHHAKTVSGDIDHTAITNIGTNSHATIDIHIADSSIHTEDNLLVHLAGIETISGVKTFSAIPVIVDDLKFLGGSGVHRIYNADAGQVISHQHYDGISADVEAFRTSETQINSYLTHIFAAGMSVTGNITMVALATVDGRDISIDGDKLDTITNVGSGIIISSAERTALHAEVTTLAHSALSGIGVSDHHTKYLDSEAISAIEGEATLALAGAVTIALGLDVTGSITGTSNFTITKPSSNIINLYEYATSAYVDYQFKENAVLDKLLRVSSTGFLFQDRNPSAVNLMTIGDSAITSYINHDFNAGIDVTGTQTFVNAGAGGDPSLSSSSGGQSLTLAGNLYPSATDTWDMGASSIRWNNIYSVAGTFTGAVSVTGTTTIGSWLSLESGAPQILLKENDASANNKNWDIVANGEDLYFRAMNDALSTTEIYMKITRAAHVIGEVQFPNGDVNISDDLLVGGWTLRSDGIFFPDTTNTGQIGASGNIVGDSFFRNTTVSNDLKIVGGSGSAIIDLVDTTNDYLRIVTNASGGVRLVVAATSWTSNSDIRLKDNITTPKILDKILALDTIEYDLYDDLEKTKYVNHQIGVSAQQLREVFPMLVFGDEADDTLSVDYAHMSALFIGTTKELNEKIEGQQTEINDLKELIINLTKRVDTLSL